MDAAVFEEDMPGATHLASGVAYLLLCSARYFDDVDVQSTGAGAEGTPI